MSIVLALALLLALPGREALGVFEGWGAFRESPPLRCYAIAETVERQGAARPFVNVATWPRQGLRNQLHVRLSRARAGNARVTLSIGERRFDLVAGASDAWAPDADTDRAIVAALRSGRSMSIESVGANGTPFADSYRLAGAATAIDAAALGCAGR